MKKLYIPLLAGMTLLFSCKKEKDEPTGNPTAQKLQKDIQGKWDFDVDFGIGARKTTSTNGKKSLFIHAIGIKDVTTNTITETEGYEAGFIEFGADSTYIIYDGYGQVYTGKYLAQSSDSIVLTNLGSIGRILINNGGLAFDLHYSSGTKTLTVTSTKVQPIPADSRTAILCKGPWKLTSEGSGSEILGTEEWDYEDGNGQSYYYTIDSLTYQASINGTYLVQIFSKGVLKDAQMARWKWHDTNPNIFLYNHENIGWDGNDFVTITQLTAQRATFKETNDNNGDDIDEEYSWILVPAK